MRRYRKHAIVYAFVIVAIVAATRWVEGGSESDAGPLPTRTTFPAPAPADESTLVIQCARSLFTSACDFAYLPE